jgi:cbb3-type cytochrome oxidase subunit 3
MTEFDFELLTLAMILFFFVVTELCLRDRAADAHDEASMMPFADDPEVARRVELATGKKIAAVAPLASMRV